jgi:hypothetical protein
MKLPEPNLINKYPTLGHYTTEQMLAWGKACAAAEREACAKLLDEMAAQDKHSNYYVVAAKAIRARGENT